MVLALEYSETVIEIEMNISDIVSGFFFCYQAVISNIVIANKGKIIHFVINVFTFKHEIKQKTADFIYN